MVLIPISQYQRDGRILNGVNHGTKSLLNAIAVESINISSDMTEQVQSLFESIESGLIKLTADDSNTSMTGFRVFYP